MRTRFVPPLSFLLVVLVLPAILCPSGALTIDVSPNRVCPTQTVSIDITDLADQSTFNYTLTSTNLVSTGLQWYNLTNFNYPFAISDGRVYIVGTNVDLIRLETKIGAVTQSIEGTGPGTVTLNFQKNINAAVYDYYRINYTVANTAVPVTITWIHNGTKSGAEDSTTTFNIEGASSGDVRCLITVNGTVERDEVVTIYSPCPEPDTGDGVGPSGLSETPATATPTVTGTSTVTPTPTPQVITFTSPDGQVIVVTSGVSFLEILPVDIPSAPPDTVVVFGPYTIQPPETPLGAPGLLSITVPDNVLRAYDPESLGIARFSDDVWEIIPSRLEGSVLTARITESGTFAVVAPTGAGTGTGSADSGEKWSWEFIPPEILTWLGQKTAGQSEPSIFRGGGGGGGSVFPWAVLFGIIVLIIAAIMIMYIRKRGKEEENDRWF
jgi:hypothetical protein